MRPSKQSPYRLPVFVVLVCALVAVPALAAPQSGGPASWSLLTQVWQVFFAGFQSPSGPELSSASLRPQGGASEDEGGARTDPVGESLRHDPSGTDVPTRRSERPAFRLRGSDIPTRP